MKGFLKIQLYNLTKYVINNYWTHKYRHFEKVYDLPQDFKFNGEGILIYGTGKISVGSGSYIGRYSQIQLKKGFSVKIGRNCRIASNVKIYTGTNITNQDFSKPKLMKEMANVEIGDNCWIGANVFIVPGVKIGENAIVGANSVVTNDIENNSINGGVPCKLLKYKL
jgi:maltose O-acetyltransferase